MKKRSIYILILTCLLVLAGCGPQPDPVEETKEPVRETEESVEETEEPVEDTLAIPFQEGQLYAVAYLGYQEAALLPYYTETWLYGTEPPVHYLSDGEYYLIIPRYEGMALRLYRGDPETAAEKLIYEDPACRPFVLQCNASDIFADARISLTCEGETVEFSPYLSLVDGSVQVGERGLELTKLEQG